MTTAEVISELFLTLHIIEPSYEIYLCISNIYLHLCCVITASPAANTASWTGSSSQIEVTPTMDGSYHIATRYKALIHM